LLKESRAGRWSYHSAARPFTNGGIYSDDPRHRPFDRYSNEYARFVGRRRSGDRKDILAAVRPFAEAQIKVVVDLVQPDGYGYAWGRSVGLISYAATLEIVGFWQCIRNFVRHLGSAGERLLSGVALVASRLQCQTHGFSMFAFGSAQLKLHHRRRELATNNKYRR